MAKKVKVFALNDCDWWAAETLEEAKADFLEEYLMTEADDPFEDPHELDDKAMDHFRIINEGGGAKRTFREELDLMISRGEKFPCFFASTEC